MLEHLPGLGGVVTGQLTLEDIRPASSLDDQFDEWIRTEHGREVYAAVIARAFRLRRSGVAHYGVKAICEAVRFSWTIRRGPDAWKVNNNWSSRLTRLAMREYPELAGFFETRELRS